MSEPMTSTAIDSRLLPMGDVGLERACRLCHEQPGLKPLVFEALLHAPLALLIDPGTAAPSPGIRLMTLERVVPMQVRHRSLGIMAFSNALFSGITHFYAFMPERGHHCFTFPDGHDLIAQLAASNRPLWVDPGTRHSLGFGQDELRAWLAAWEDTPRAPDPFEQGGCEFRQAVAHPQLLLDRLATFLARLQAVERAYLVWVRPLGSKEDFHLTLVIRCPDTAVTERIRRALPLLNQGLGRDETPQRLLSITCHPGFERDAATLLQPIYDRSIGQWLVPRPA